MGGIFINYRGDDSDTAAMLIDRELEVRFGSDQVFLDNRSIPAGADFVAELLGRLRTCSVLVVVIGPRWLTVTNAAGQRRIDDPADWVRREIAEALDRGLRVIPVLTGDAVLPTEADLPLDIAGLSRRQYVPLRRRYTNVDLRYLVERIIEADAELAEVAARHRSSTGPVPRQLVAPPHVASPSLGERVMAGYRAYVRNNFAPGQLLDREAELDELAAFCSGDQPYAWWQAGPWAGKSALLSWFVLNPPAGVDVVSFFVTARLPGQSDSDACAQALIEQLAALLGESAPNPLTAIERQRTLLEFLDTAATRSREAGRRLLVVIDGLDEDSGTRLSIAALLPARPPAEARVLVASRSHLPIPDDVDDDHPLLAIKPRQLDVSEHARGVERRAKRELTLLSTRGSGPEKGQLHRHVLGLITAAGGGLALVDLEQLTGRASSEIESLLSGSFGRSVSNLTVDPVAGHCGERVYFFTHETLRLVAERQYGASLAAYRDQLHDWADTYRQQDWPDDTPHYLLRSYPRMLASIEDVPRLVVCGTDQARHNRMRGLTGGDALALTEISIAQQGLLAQSDPDLTSLARLAVHRDNLSHRSIDFPAELPAVWARIGQSARAEGLVNNMHDWGTRRDALCQLVAAAAASSDHDRAVRLADEAEAFIGPEIEPVPGVFALTKLAQAVAGSDRERAARLVSKAEALVEQIPDPTHRQWALADLVGAMVISGDHDRAETLARQITYPWERGEVLTRLIRVMSASDDRGRTSRLVDEAELLIVQISDPIYRESVLIGLAEAVAAGGDHDRAQALAGRVIDPARRAEILARLATASGDHDRAAQLFAEVETLADAREQESARLEEALADEDDHDHPLRKAARAMMLEPSERMRTLAEGVTAAGNYARAEALIGQITDPNQRDWALDPLVKGVLAGGDYARAEALIRHISEPYNQMWALARLAAELAVDGERDWAARLADEVETRWRRRNADPYWQVRALSQLVKAVALGGDRDRTARLIDEAAALIGQITDTGRRRFALLELVEATATNGDDERTARLADEAEALIREITSDDDRAEKLTRLAGAVAAVGDRDRAARLVAEVGALSEQFIGPDFQAEVLTPLVGVVAACGNHEWTTQVASAVEALIREHVLLDSQAEMMSQLMEVAAASGDHVWTTRLARDVETLIGQIPYPDSRERALGRLARVAADSGDHDYAEALAGQITDPSSRNGVLAGLVEVAVASGGFERVARLADAAEAHIGQGMNPYQRVWALARLVEAVAASGDHQRAARLASEAEALIGQIIRYREEAMARLAGAAAASGDHDMATRLADAAEALVGQVSDPFQNELVLLVTASAISGYYDRAEAFLARIADPGRRAFALASLATASVADVDHDRMTWLIDKAEVLVGLVRQAPYPGFGAEQLAEVIEAVAVEDNHALIAPLTSEVEELARLITDPNSRAGVLSRLVKAAAASANHTQVARLANGVETLITQITSESWQADALNRLAGAVARSDRDRTARLLTEAETLIEQITNLEFKVSAMVGLVEAVAASGDHGRATRLMVETETLIGEITYSGKRERALGRLVGVVGALGDHDRAEALAGQMTDPYEQLGALAQLVKVVAVGGDRGRAARLTDKAEALTERISDPRRRMGTLDKLPATALAGLVEAVAAGGDHRRAARLTDKAEALTEQITGLGVRSQVMTQLAEVLAKTSNETSPIPGAVRNGSPLMVRARHLLAKELVSGSWADAVESLAYVEPLAVTELADAVDALWGLNSFGHRNNMTLAMPDEQVRSRQTRKWAQRLFRWVRSEG